LFKAQTVHFEMRRHRAVKEAPCFTLRLQENSKAIVQTTDRIVV